MSKSSNRRRRLNALWLPLLLVPTTGVECDEALGPIAAEESYTGDEPEAEAEPASPIDTTVLAGAAAQENGPEPASQPAGANTTDAPVTDDSPPDGDSDGGGSRGAYVYSADLVGREYSILDETLDADFPVTELIVVGLRDGAVATVDIPGFASVPTLRAEIGPVDERREYTGVPDDENFLAYTVAVTTRSVESLPDGVVLVLDLDVAASGGSLIEWATGTHRVEANWTATAMSYAGSTHYVGVMKAGAPGVETVRFDVRHEWDFTGTLTRE